MHQEVVQNKKGSAWIDLILVIVLLVCIIMIKKLANLFQQLPVPFNIIAQAAVFALIIVGCLLLYKKRLCSYRYTMIHHQPEEGELNAFGDAQKYPYDVGTICFERMVGNKGRISEMLMPNELRALAAPDEDLASAAEKLGEQPINFFRTETFTILPKKTAHKLLYTRKGKLYAAYFHPTDELVKLLNEYLSGVGEKNTQAAEDNKQKTE